VNPIRSILVILALFSSCLPGLTDTVKAPKIHVYIIGVVDLDIEPYNVTNEAIRLECNILRDYFKGRFGDAADVKKYCTHDETTREAIRRYLAVDLHKEEGDDLNFVFFMSHGKAIDYANQFLHTDLQIIASDTKEKDVEFTSISAATELVPWLEKQNSHSTTLVFLDVCYGGKAKNLSTQLTGKMQELFGAKNLIIASSLANDKSYEAAFTETVLNIIKGKECVPEQSLKSRIADTISPNVGKTLTGTEGYPDMIIKYDGDFCLGDLGEGGKLLFVYTGQEPETTQYRIVRTSGNVREGPAHIRNPYFTRREDPGEYTIYVQRADGQETKFQTVDLNTQDFDVVWIDQNVGYKTAATFLTKTADDVLADANVPDTAGRLRLAAAGIYHRNNDLKSYERVMDLVPEDVKDRLIGKDVLAAAFDKRAVQKLVRGPGTDSVSLAGRLALAGDFKNAAMVANVAAAHEGDPATKKTIQEEAQLFLAASGKTNAAKVLREQDTIWGATQGLQGSAGDRNTVQSREVLTAVTAVSTLPSWSKSGLELEEAKGKRVFDKKSDADQIQLAANQELSATKLNPDTNIGAIQKRVSDLDDYQTVAEATVSYPARKYTLDHAAKADLDKLAALALSTNSYLIEVVGYDPNTDSSQLSQNRASAVTIYLQSRWHIPNGRIVVLGDGATLPRNTDRQGALSHIDVKLIVNKGLQ
jgi:outer membrane protein OmpA-like peptidoglycan-associated protein